VALPIFFQIDLTLEKSEDAAVAMLKQTALTLLLAAQFVPFCSRACANSDYAISVTIEDYEFGRAGYQVTCKGESLPEDFACALVFNLDPPVPDGIASVSGGEYDLIRGIALRLDGTLYTAVFDPPLKKENGFSGVEKHAGILAKVDGDYLLVRWPNGKEARAKIMGRERINPNRPSAPKAPGSPLAENWQRNRSGLSRLSRQ